MTSIPHNRAAEESVIGSVLINPDSFLDCQFLQPQDFYIVRHQWIWEAFAKLIANNTPIELITVENELDGRMLETGGSAFLTNMLSQTSSSLHAETYARIVEADSIRRHMLTAAGQIATLAYKEGESVDDLLLQTEKAVSSLSQRNQTAQKHTVNMETAVAKALDATTAAGKGERSGTTGLPDLDNLLFPQKGELIVIGARPGQGKTGLLGDIAIANARLGKRVLSITTESSSTVITQRLLAKLSGVDASRIMRGSLTAEEWEKIYAAVEELQGLQITICDLPEIRIGQLKTESKRHPYDIITLDYLQLTGADKKNDRRDLDIGEVTRGCLGIAKDLDIPFFAAAQLGRDAEGREPVLSDLRESGSIEQDARSVVFIYRTPTSCELIIAKHNNGACGRIAAYFHPETISFNSGVYSGSIGKQYPD